MRCADEHACLNHYFAIDWLRPAGILRGRWSENVSAIVGVGSVGLAALVTAFIGVDFFANGEQTYSQPLWTWMSVGDFNIGFNLVLDGLSLTMLSVVTGVGFLIHMYASLVYAR